MNIIFVGSARSHVCASLRVQLPIDRLRHLLIVFDALDVRPRAVAVDGLLLIM